MVQSNLNHRDTEGTEKTWNASFGFPFCARASHNTALVKTLLTILQIDRLLTNLLSNPLRQAMAEVLDWPRDNPAEVASAPPNICGAAMSPSCPPTLLTPWPLMVCPSLPDAARAAAGAYPVVALADPHEVTDWLPNLDGLGPAGPALLAWSLDAAERRRAVGGPLSAAAGRGAGNCCCPPACSPCVVRATPPYPESFLCSKGLFSLPNCRGVPCRRSADVDWTDNTNPKRQRGITDRKRKRGIDTSH